VFNWLGLVGNINSFIRRHHRICISYIWPRTGESEDVHVVRNVLEYPSTCVENINTNSLVRIEFEKCPKLHCICPSIVIWNRLGVSFVLRYCFLIINYNLVTNHYDSLNQKAAQSVPLFYQFVVTCTLCVNLYYFNLINTKKIFFVEFIICFLINEINRNKTVCYV